MARVLIVPSQPPTPKSWVKEICYLLAWPFLALGAIWDGIMGKPFGDD